ncbi:helix-hairpin-helix domain-containing protein [Deinococcus sp. KNUC1210]|uniref:ComEA family DNA-binding protein n=1 Tax=Deinococcus sp. KNUC1210 TaxID=2917691 RepID=UPI001EF06F44|nr:helix-hairpin-helix domain-containing protein [Deinococcus sp. KNUC1210]ULH16627.1 helix-hairpin-helix domain-containing protein [Deinococcus sp. KNUC1210]
MKRPAHVLLGLLTAVTLAGTALAASGTTTAMSSTTMKMPKPTVTLPPAGFKVNVNTGTAADLLKVPGLSQKVVDDLIKNRPYKDQAELVKKVKGIGPKNVLKMAPYFSY